MQQSITYGQREESPYVKFLYQKQAEILYKFKGEETKAVNMLSGSLEADKIFQEGDIAQVVISYSNGEILSVMMSDHYRLDKELLLAGIFVLLLIGFAGRTGLRAVYSFMITILAIWKILTPAYLKGANPKMEYSL